MLFYEAIVSQMMLILPTLHNFDFSVEEGKVPVNTFQFCKAPLRSCMQVAVPLSSLGDRGRSSLVGLISLWCSESPPDTACTATEREASQAYAFPCVWAMFFLVHVHDFPLSAADLNSHAHFSGCYSVGFSTCSSAKPLSLCHLS